MLKIKYPYSVILTGGISTGKSSVSNLLTLDGFRVIDVDSLSREIFSNNITTLNSMFREYNIDLAKDKNRFRKLVFSNFSVKKKLEDFIHPKIYDRVVLECEKLEKMLFPYFIDIPLYYESNRYTNFSKYVIVVYTNRATQLKRLIERDHLSVFDANSILDIQIDIEKKREMADFIIDNSKDLQYLQNECEKISKFFKTLDY